MFTAGFAPWLIILIVLGALVVGGAVYHWWPGKSGQFCTQEAKICPDGTSVGRTGPDCEFAPCPTKDVILSELEKLNIQIAGGPQRMEMVLPASFSGPDWGLKKSACEDGGYDLSPYVGKSVLFTSYPIDEKYNNESLDVWIISSGDKIACVYKAVGKDSNVAPGIFPVKDQSVNKNDETVNPSINN